LLSRLKLNTDFRLIIMLLVLIPLGLSTKFYTGPYQDLINNSISDVIYEVFWILLIFLIKKNLKPFFIALFVFVFTAIIEFSQLLHFSWLESLRNNFLGKTLLGTNFVKTDFIYYLLGCIIGYYILKYLKKSDDKQVDTIS